MGSTVVAIFIGMLVGRVGVVVVEGVVFVVDVPEGLEVLLVAPSSAPRSALGVIVLWLCGKLSRFLMAISFNICFMAAYYKHHSHTARAITRSVTRLLQLSGSTFSVQINPSTACSLSF